MFIVWLLPRCVISVGQDSLRRHDTTAVSWNSLYNTKTSQQTTTGQLVGVRWFYHGSVHSLTLLLLRMPLPFDFPRHHGSWHRNQRPCGGGRGWVPDCDGWRTLCLLLTRACLNHLASD